VVRRRYLGDFAPVQYDLNFFAVRIDMQSTGVAPPCKYGKQFRHTDIRCLAHERHSNRHLNYGNPRAATFGTDAGYP
jgi:hypothetical protein